MEKIYEISQFEEGDLITQDGLLLTTEGSFTNVDLITQSGDTLLTQSGDTLQGRIYDLDDVFVLQYRVRTNIDRFVRYIDENKVNQISVSKKIYNPTITEKIYGN